MSLRPLLPVLSQLICSSRVSSSNASSRFFLLLLLRLLIQKSCSTIQKNQNKRCLLRLLPHLVSISFDPFFDEIAEKFTLTVFWIYSRKTFFFKKKFTKIQELKKNQRCSKIPLTSFHCKEAELRSKVLFIKSETRNWPRNCLDSATGFRAKNYGRF